MTRSVCVIVGAGPGNGSAFARRFAHVVIDAVVDMPASRAMFPDCQDDFFAQPADIAESVYLLTQQPRSAWTFELDLRPFGETW